ncbi:MAG: hypothetical protein JSV10_09945 [Candidatus Zixiibacteriota bacterium]|nr:MAG: hypothetical protein JSV10_09945 [candidate division Zixibacteria bacterium]
MARPDGRASARKSFVFVLAGMMVFFFAPLASADVPHMINYQGKLTDAGGGLVNDTVQMTFSIYPDTLGSPADWSETQMQVIVEDGIFNVLLGAADTIPSAVFDGNVKYLGVQVESDPEMAPLKPMVSVPYAYRAGSTDGAGGGGGWVDDGSVVRLETDTDQVGIGTTSPEANLEVNDRIRVAGDWARVELLSAPNTAAGKISQDGNGHIKVAAPTGAGNVILETQGTGRLSVKQDGTIYTHGASNVGIGTEAPLSKQHIQESTVSLSPDALAADVLIVENNDAIVGLYSYEGGTLGSGITFGEITAGVLADKWGILRETAGGGKGLRVTYGTDSDQGVNPTLMYLDDSGNVGIGTTSPAEKLDVRGNMSVYDISSMQNQFDITNASGHGITINNDNVGIGTTNPQSRLSVGGDGVSDAAIYGEGAIGIRGYGSVCGVYGQSPTQAIVGTHPATGNSGVLGDENFGVYADCHTTGGAGIRARAYGDCYSADLWGRVLIRNNSGTTVMELGEGLDYAEGFDVSNDKKIDPGSVLIIDPDNPGKLAISDQPYDKKVAGIVAGANGQGSGVRLGADQFDFDVALAGRVYCNVDAKEAGVQPGDLLTTSATPGYAMKVTDYARAQGSILGKAMQRLEKGKKGQILVLVTLQ